MTLNHQDETSFEQNLVGQKVHLEKICLLKAEMQGRDLMMKIQGWDLTMKIQGSGETLPEAQQTQGIDSLI